MPSMESFLAGLDPALVYLVVAALAFGESVSFLSLLLPGEVALVAAAAVAGPVGVDPFLLGAVAVGAAALGGWCGYELGRRYGSALVAWRPLARRVDGGLASVKRRLESGRGFTMVLVGRFNQLTRVLVPAVAGMVEMPRGRFVWANLVGAVAWGAAFTIVGSVAAEWWRSTSGPIHAVIAVMVASAAGVWWAMGRDHDGQRPRD